MTKVNNPRPISEQSSATVFRQLEAIGKMDRQSRDHGGLFDATATVSTSFDVQLPKFVGRLPDSSLFGSSNSTCGRIDLHFRKPAKLGRRVGTLLDA